MYEMGNIVFAASGRITHTYRVFHPCFPSTRSMDRLRCSIERNFSPHDRKLTTISQRAKKRHTSTTTYTVQLCICTSFALERAVVECQDFQCPFKSSLVLWKHPKSMINNATKYSESKIISSIIRPWIDNATNAFPRVVALAHNS